MSDLDKWGPLTEFRIELPDNVLVRTPSTVLTRIDRAMTAAQADLPTWHFDRFTVAGDAFQTLKGSAPSSLVAVIAALAQGDDPTILLDRLEIP